MAKYLEGNFIFLIFASKTYNNHLTINAYDDENRVL
jgi:hypothetical protein